MSKFIGNGIKQKIFNIEKTPRRSFNRQTKKENIDYYKVQVASEFLNKEKIPSLQDTVIYINQKLTNQGKNSLQITEKFFTSICLRKHLFDKNLQIIYKSKDNIVNVIVNMGTLGFDPKNISSMLNNAGANIGKAIDDLANKASKYLTK